MEKFFAFVSRANAILLLALLLVLLAAGGFMLGDVLNLGRPAPRGAVQVAASGQEGPRGGPLTLWLGRVEPVAGTGTLMIELSARQPRGHSLSSGSRYDSDVHNLLFVDASRQGSRWLFPAQGQKVLDTEQLGAVFDERQVREPCRAIYVEYVDGDSDGDGSLGPGDRSSVGLAQADGSGWVRVLKGVTRVLSRSLMGPDKLSVLYQSGQTLRHAVFTVPAGNVLADKVVAELPVGR